MIRLIVENILLFLAPTILFVVFTMFRRADKKHNTVTGALDAAPLPLLFTLGFILMISVLAYYGTQSNSGKPGQTYRPPELVDGKIKPGTFE